MKMVDNILIMGTSNSLLKRGWVEGLRKALPNANIVNISIGGSPGTQYCCAIPQYDFSKFDYVVFDSVPNDELGEDFIGDPMFLNRVTFEIVSTIAAQTKVIVLGFCMARHAVKPSDIYLERRRIAAICGAQFISMREFAMRYGHSILGGSDDLIFETYAHPRQAIQNRVGFELGALLAQGAFPESGIRAESFAHHFSTFDPAAADSTVGAVVNKKNSLMDVNFRVFDGDYTYPVPVDLPCVGFYMDILNTRCYVKLAGPKGARVKEYMFNIQPEKFEVRFIPILNGFSVSEMTVAGRFLPFERSAFSTLANWPNKLRPAQLTLGKMGFWGGAAYAASPRRESDALVLHRAIEAKISAQYAARPEQHWQTPTGFE
ncbi:hypothetical protein [Rhodoblastus acidophilus]|nr:hypothetical protein [Rhodoblastus acidophilus]